MKTKEWLDAQISMKKALVALSCNEDGGMAFNDFSRRLHDRWYGIAIHVRSVEEIAEPLGMLDDIIIVPTNMSEDDGYRYYHILEYNGAAVYSLHDYFNNKVNNEGVE